MDEQRQHAMDDAHPRQIFMENQAHGLPIPPPQLRALAAVMLDSEEELEEILGELPVHDLGKLLVYCERLKQAVASKRQERLHGADRPAPSSRCTCGSSCECCCICNDKDYTD